MHFAHCCSSWALPPGDLARHQPELLPQHQAHGLCIRRGVLQPQRCAELLACLADPGSARRTGRPCSSLQGLGTVQRHLVWLQPGPGLTSRPFAAAGGHLVGYNSIEEHRSVESLLKGQGCLLQPFHRYYWLGLTLDQIATLGAGGVLGRRISLYNTSTSAS